MSTNRGIFDSFPSQPGTRADSPFAVVNEPSVEPASAPSPFTAVGRAESPFMVVDDGEARAGEFGRPVRLPEKRKVDSPFQVAEPSEGFGFEAPARAIPASPFEVQAAVPASPFSVEAQAAPVSPFAAAPQAVPASPFAVAEAAKAASPATQAAIAAFTQWQEPPAAPPAPAPAPQVAVAPAAPAPVVEAQPVAPAQVPSAFAPAPQAVPVPQAAPVQQAVAAPVTPSTPVSSYDEGHSDSSSIRQLELRAIFGVDREMSGEEILQRSRALPGMKNIARVGPNEMATIEAIKTLLPNLGFGSGNLKLYAGSVPLEFIREGGVLLAVQTDGGFAPGVRETLMIVARELNRLG